MRREEAKGHLKRNPEEYLRLQEIFGEKLDDAIKYSLNLLELKQKLVHERDNLYYDQYGQRVTMTANGIRKIGFIDVDSEEHFGMGKRMEKLRNKVRLTTFASMGLVFFIFIIIMNS